MTPAATIAPMTPTIRRAGPVNPLVVGVDPHRALHQVCVMDREGQELLTHFRVSNNRSGIASLAQRLSEVVGAGGFDQIQLATEATNWFWLGMFYELSQAEVLCGTSLKLYAINPRLAHNFKKTLTNTDHTDRHDAFVVAERLRMGRDLPKPFTPDPVYQPLRLLTRYRYHLMRQLVREKAYALNVIYLKASEYTAPNTQPFADVCGATSKAILTEFVSCEDILALSLDELAERIDALGKKRFADPRDNARKLRAVAEQSFVLPNAFETPINTILSTSFRHITALEQHVKALDAQIAEQLRAIPNTLTTVPGIGPVLAAGIIAELGDITRFDGDDDKIAKFAGFKWQRHQSADFVAQDTPISRSCNHYLRYYLCEAANFVRIRDPEYAAFYKRKFDEASKHQHKRAIVLTARKLVRLVTRLLTTHQPFRVRSAPPSVAD